MGLLLGSCAASTSGDGAPPLARDASELAQRFPGAQRILPGIEIDDGAPGWRTGDRGLLGLERVGEDGLERWLIELECVEEESEGVSIHSQSSMTLTTDAGKTLEIQATEVKFEVRLRDAEGKLLETTRPIVPAGFLSEGLFDACELAASMANSERGWEGSGSELSDEELVKFARGVACCVSLVQVLEDDSALGPILMDIVRRPPLYTFLTHGGVDLGIAPALDRTRSESIRFAGRDEAGFVLPLTMTANDRVALECELFVLPPTPPLHVVGGIVAIESSGATQAGRSFRITLLGAERGAEDRALTVTE